MLFGDVVGRRFAAGATPSARGGSGRGAGVGRGVAGDGVKVKGPRDWGMIA
jgi:hypothetical protein